MKIQDDSFEQSPQSFSKPTSKSLGSKNNRKYNKITHDLRMKFLDKIFFENKSIKKAAQELNINYSSAKTILNLHRKKQRFQQQPPTSVSDISSEIDSAKICGFSSQTLFKKQKLELVVTLGGRLMNSNKIDPSSINAPFILTNADKIVLPQQMSSSVNMYKQISLTPEDLFLQQQQHSQQQQLLLKLLQEQQLQEQQRLQQQQQLQQQLALNPELYSLLLEKQKQQDQQQLLIAQILQQQQQQQQQQKSSSSFGLF